MSLKAYQAQRARPREGRAAPQSLPPSFLASPGPPEETDLKAQVEKASRYGHSLDKLIAQRQSASGQEAGSESSSALPIQRKITIQGGEMQGEYATKGGKATNALVSKLKDDPRSDDWKRGWIEWVRLKAKVKGNEDFADFAELADAVHAKYDQPKTKVKRPGFSSATYTLAKGVHSVRTGVSDPDLSLADEDLAVPHRMPYADLKGNLDRFTSGAETSSDLTRWTDRLVDATKKRKRQSLSKDKDDLLPSNYSTLVDKQVDDFRRKRKKLVDDEKTGTLSGTSKATLDFLAALNSLHGNVPDLGPHTTVNIPVSDRGHPNVARDGSMSPGTEAMVNMSPGRLRKGIATTSDGKSFVTPDGRAVPVLKLPPHVLNRMKKHSLSKTTIDPDDLV